MIKLFKSIKLYLEYRKIIKKNYKFLSNKYALEKNLQYELYTTFSIDDAPEDMKQKYGNALAEYELKKYTKSLNKDFEKLELEELIRRIEIKALNRDKTIFGIAYGFSLTKNIYMYIAMLLMYIIPPIALIVALVILL